MSMVSTTRVVKFIRKGENGISVSLIPGTLSPIVGEKNMDMQIQVALYDGGRLIPYNDPEDGNMLCTLLPNQLEGVQSYKWNFTIDKQNRFFYHIWIIPLNTTPIRIPITVTYKDVEYEQVICINPVANGADGETGPQGATLRGPMSWTDCATGFTFYAGEKGEQFLDIVEYNGFYYMCKKTHAKASNNAPGSVEDTSQGYWRLAQNLPFVASKIVMTEYAVVKNLGVECVEMRDNLRNVVFLAKGGVVQCNTGVFKNITVSGNSHFGGTLDGVTGSFKSLNCVDDGGQTVASMRFSGDGFFEFANGDISHQGTKDSRNLRFRTSDVWCRGAFGHLGRTFAVITDRIMSIYSSKNPQGRYTPICSNYFLEQGANDYYRIPMYGGPSTFDAPGMAIDTVIIRSLGKWHYAFIQDTMECGKEWRVINPIRSGNEIYICEEGGWRRINSGKSVLCTYIDPLFCDPSASSDEIGLGIFAIG